MEISPFTVYLWQQADSFITIFKAGSLVLCILCIVSLVLLVMSLAASETSSYNSKERNDEITAAATAFFRTKFLPCFAISVFACLFTSAIPSTKTIAVMYVVPTIENSKPFQQDLPELYQMGVEALKAQLAPQNPVKVEAAAK